MESMDKTMTINQFDYLQPIINHMKLTLFEHGHLKSGTEWNHKNIYTPYNRLYFVLDGNGLMKNEALNLSLQPGKAYLIPRDNILDLSCDDYLEKFYIHFSLEILPGQDLFEQSDLPYYEKTFEPERINLFLKSLSTNKLDSMIYCQGILLEYISYFLENHHDKIKEQLLLASKYDELFNYIRNHPYASIRVKDIAHQFNLSSNYLSQKFSQDIGITLKKYIDYNLVKRAEEKLIFSQLSIKAIAHEMKFSDEFHFSRFFKKYRGVSPTEYRRKNSIKNN